MVEKGHQFPQLPLHIGLRDSATFANFFAGSNAAIVHAMNKGIEPFLFLWGGQGCGKTHLLQALCHEAGMQGLAALYLPMADVYGLGTDILENLEQMDLLCIDDVQLVCGDSRWETALFHLYNRVREAGKRMVVAADAAPMALPVNLPDLASRLGWGPVFQIKPLDDGEKASALQLRAKARGMVLPDESALYLIRHASRDLHDLFALLERLDHASLAAQRRLTVPFIREFIH